MSSPYPTPQYQQYPQGSQSPQSPYGLYPQAQVAVSPPAGVPGFSPQTLLKASVEAVTQPKISTYMRWYPTASWPAIWAGYLVYGAVLALVSTVQGAGAASLVYLVLAPIGALIGTAIVYAIGLIFGGFGTFKGYAYLLALYGVPLGIASTVLGLLPGIGNLFVFVLGCYGIGLLVLASRAGHRMKVMGTGAMQPMQPMQPMQAGAYPTNLYAAVPAAPYPQPMAGSQGNSAASTTVSTGATSPVVSAAAPLAPVLPPPARMCSNGHIVADPQAQFCVYCGGPLGDGNRQQEHA